MNTRAFFEGYMSKVAEEMPSMFPDYVYTPPTKKPDYSKMSRAEENAASDKLVKGLRGNQGILQANMGLEYDDWKKNQGNKNNMLQQFMKTRELAGKSEGIAKKELPSWLTNAFSKSRGGFTGWDGSD